ncbi:M60 family metallopeptidase [Curtobacterium sp. PhB115]|uniref:M60 family metallopeptidase n=1 Tax=Curtobacterium sp. PhB115 TaxID=2485173 RepID=UPI000F4C2344|nr:M60 family metallopeptidase [Curtobacterium sp. PhB115]ROP74834.1 carbohydrate-binding protein (putative mucin) [Curtobacterium sp. PhB115]
MSSFLPRPVLPAVTAAATVASVLVTTLVGVPAAGSSERSTVALPGGPLPTAIVRSADTRSTDVLVHGLGSPEAERIREGRNMRHSGLQPTGRFVRSGQTITVQVPSGAPTMRVETGLIGPYAAFNGGAEVGITAADLTAGRNEVTADRDGMVFLSSTAPSGSATVTVSGGTTVPTFVTGQTSNAEFAAEVERFPDAPMATIVGERVFGDFQARTVPTMSGDLASRVEDWDRVVQVTNEHHGLLDDAVGAARKAPHRIYIASPDSGAGYANASHDRIMFQVDTAAASELFTMRASGLWGFWHEVGHTYQPPAYNWKGMVEVVNNVSALDVQHRLFGANRLDGQQTAIAAFFARPVEARSFADEDSVWARLLMFDQLRRAFGQQFWPALDQELRVRLRTGDATVHDDDAKRAAFTLTAARVADRDLRPFFRQWGFPLDPAVADAMADLPALTTPIWENRGAASDTVQERELPRYGVPVGVPSSVTEPVAVGQRQLETAPTATGIGNTDGIGTAHITGHALEAREPGTGTASVVLRNDRGIREVLATPVRVGPGNAIRFTGIGDETIGWLALDPLAGALRFVPVSTAAAHPYFDGEEYVGFALRTADGRTLGDWSIDGDENGTAVAAAFAQDFEDGQVLEVRHAEPRSRLTAFRDGEELPHRPEKLQRFRIVDDRIEPIADEAVGVLPVETTGLVRGTDTPVSFGIVAGRELTSIRADLVVTAPDGTVFAEGQTSLVGQYRNPGDDWRTAASMTMRSGQRSPDGRTTTFRLDTTTTFRLVQGAAARWSPLVHTPEDAMAGQYGMHWEFSGTTNAGSVRIGS